MPRRRNRSNSPDAVTSYASFDDFYLAQATAVRASVRRTAALWRVDPEDLFQEVMLRVFARFAVIEAPREYAVTVARRLAARWARGAGRNETATALHDDAEHRTCSRPLPTVMGRPSLWP